MAQAAQLRAGDLVLELGFPQPGPHLGGRDVGDEPDGNRQARDGVLLHAELWHAEAVNHVLAAQPHDDRLVHGQVELIERRDVVFRGRIGAVEPKRVRLEVEQLDVRAAEYPVVAGVVDVPRELLAGDLHEQRVALRGNVIDPRGPERDREREQEDHLNDQHGSLEVAGRVRRGSVVIGDGMPRTPEPDQAVGEEPAPPDEEDEHEDVRPADQAVNLAAVSRRERRESEPFSHGYLDTLWSSDHSESSSMSAMRFARLRR